MRAIVYLLAAVGVGLLGYGAYSLYDAATDDDSINQIAGYSMGGGFAIAGLVMLLAARRLWGAAPAKVRNGVAGYAQVNAVHDTGVTVHGTQLLVKLDVTASAPGIAPYPAAVTVKLGRPQWGAIQPGMSVPVLIDPTDHRKVAYDYERPVQAGAGVPGLVGGPAGGQVVTRSAADLIAQGVPVMGTLFSAQSSGLTAGQAAAGLPPDQADDPLVSVSFGYAGPDGQQRTMTALVRVPDGKQLSAGQPVPVSYLPNDPDTATIDWSRM
jgi:hypothetical protein